MGRRSPLLFVSPCLCAPVIVSGPRALHASSTRRSFTSFSSWIHPSRVTQRRQRASDVIMSLRRPGGKGLPYYDQVRKAEKSPVAFRGNGAAGGNGLGDDVAREGLESLDSVRVEEMGSSSTQTLPSFFGFRFAVPGRLLLLLVPVLWSSYSICVKWLYRLPWALTPSAFNCVRLFLASLTVLPSLIGGLRVLQKEGRDNDIRAITIAGFELGLYTFFVNIMQAYGLRFTTASRAAFLGQLSTIVVPIVAFAFGMERTLGWNIGIAAVMSICGVGFLTLDNVGPSFSVRGDGMMMATALVGATYLLRSKVHAGKVTSGPLVSMKISFQALFALVYLAGGSVLYNGGSFPSVSSLFVGATPGMIAVNVAFVLWAAVFVSVLSTLLQIRGQRLVSASEAVVILSFTPLWASILAIPLGERFGLKGMAGAGLILLSTLLASRSDLGQNESAKKV